jgi:toxin HigB-1
VKVSYKTNKLKDLLNTQKDLIRAFGKKVAKAVMVRHQLLKSSSTLQDLPHTPPVRCHALKGNRKGQYAMDTAAKSGFRIIFRPDHEPVPENKDGSVDRSQVTDVEVLDVINYHDE